MVVPVPVPPVQAADMEWFGTLQMIAGGIQNVGAVVATVTTYLEAVRGALGVSTRELREDFDAAEILDADMLAALAPAGQAPLLDATAGAAARLFATVSSGSPLVPGAIHVAGYLISAVYEVDDQAPGPPGLLQIAIRDLEVAFGFGGPQADAESHFADLQLLQGHPACMLWTQATARAKKFASCTVTMLNVAAWEAMDAAELVRSHCLVQSPERKDHMRELEMNLRMAIKYVNKALVSLDAVGKAVVLMDQALQFIGSIVIHLPMNP